MSEKERRRSKEAPNACAKVLLVLDGDDDSRERMSNSVSLHV